MSLADLSQHILYRHFRILEIKLHRRRAFNAHFMLLWSLGKAFRATVNYKRSEFIPVHFGKYRIYICKATVGDPAFLSVQQVIFPVGAQLCRCFSAQRIAAAVRLRKPVRSLPLTRGKLRDILLLLGVGAEI